MNSIRHSVYVDPGWEHGVAQDERKKKVRCNYCGKVVSGGIYRLKQHLARLSGEVTHCVKAPEEVRLKMSDVLEGCRVGKRSRQRECDEQSYLNLDASDDFEEEDDVGCRNRGKLLPTEKDLIDSTPLRSLGYVDPGWEHGIPQDDRKKKVKCNYCEKIVSGGINRFKQHLARIPGEVAPCKHAPEAVYLKIKENMKWHRTGKRLRRPGTQNSSSLYLNSENEEEENELESPYSIRKNNFVPGSKRFERDSKNIYGVSTSGTSEIKPRRPRFDALKKTKKQMLVPEPDKHVKSCSSRSSRREVMSAISKFFCHAGIPFHTASSSYFHKMLEAVGRYGPDLVGPPSNSLSGRLLKDEMFTIRNHLEEYKSSWAVTGCSILADSWKDIQGKVLINVLVSSPRGVYFLCSVDATGMIDDAHYLYELLDRAVEEMGEENVVQVITQNTPSYRTAGKMLEERRRNLFWTPCATYCVDRILEEFLNLNRVRDCMMKGQKITRFIYNNLWLLNLLKNEFTGGEDLLRPSITRFASSFTTLQSLFDHRVALRNFFQSNQWTLSKFSRSEEGKDVKNIILCSTFWRNVQYVRRSTDPIMDVVQKLNSDEGISMPFIYNYMQRAKLAIKVNHNDDPRKCEPFCSIIDDHWSELFLHPLYLAANFLNPSFRYRADFILHPDVVRGLNASLVRLESDNAKRISASMQISDFGSAKADFGTDLAISTRSELDPAAWWQQHGINCLELQRIAVRILSQSCSSFGCEHNWSIHDLTYIQKHNRVGQKKLNDAIYVHYNLRLRERRNRKKFVTSASFDTIMHEDLLYDWIVETANQTPQEDEEIEMDEGNMYENDSCDFEDGNVDSRKGSLDLLVEQHLDSDDHHTSVSSDDHDLDLMDDITE